MIVNYCILSASLILLLFRTDVLAIVKSVGDVQEINSTKLNKMLFKRDLVVFDDSLAECRYSPSFVRFGFSALTATYSLQTDSLGRQGSG
jgi:hypothetical protein